MEIRRNFFSVRVVDSWNNIPDNVRSVAKSEQFQQKYKQLRDYTPSKQVSKIPVLLKRFTITKYKIRTKWLAWQCPQTALATGKRWRPRSPENPTPRKSSPTYKKYFIGNLLYYNMVVNLSDISEPVLVGPYHASSQSNLTLKYGLLLHLRSYLKNHGTDHFQRTFAKFCYNRL
jgi:hypothetical protein